jgi:hypothetical protein
VNRSQAPLCLHAPDTTRPTGLAPAPEKDQVTLDV